MEIAFFVAMQYFQVSFYVLVFDEECKDTFLGVLILLACILASLSKRGLGRLTTFVSLQHPPFRTPHVKRSLTRRQRCLLNLQSSDCSQRTKSECRSDPTNMVEGS